MPKFHLRILLPLLWGLACPASAAEDPDRAWLAQRIYANECNSEPRCLTSWNVGEEFPSLGIGHFIWYRAGQQAPFTETFPALLAFVAEHGVPAPDWIVANDVEQPWPDRESFLAALDGPRLTGLRDWLEATMPQQAAFIVARFAAGLEEMLAAAPTGERQGLRRRVDALLAADPRYGIYALIDYVHFKGEGTNPAERYAGEGWGLLQVLRAMPDNAALPLEAFVEAADAVLTRRVANAPAERNEARWLAGWRNRLQTYLPGDQREVSPR